MGLILGILAIALGVVGIKYAGAAIIFGVTAIAAFFGFRKKD